MVARCVPHLKSPSVLADVPPDGCQLPDMLASWPSGWSGAAVLKCRVRSSKELKLLKRKILLLLNLSTLLSSAALVLKTFCHSYW
jgi:hypothetical protein